jgi:hypothetical protein
VQSLAPVKLGTPKVSLRQFKVVFDAIRGLMKQPEPKRRGIGFTAKFDD